MTQFEIDMKILHAMTQTELTGSEVFCYELSREQVQDHSLVFVSDAFHLPFPGTQRVWPLSRSRFFDRVKAFFFLRRLLQTEKPDLIHCHSRGAVRHLSLARLGLGIPLLTTLHGRQHFSWSKVFFKGSFGDRVTVICENLQEDLVRKFRFSSKKISLIRNPLPETPANPHNKSRSSVLGWVGRASGPKGQRFSQLLQTALRPLLAQHPSLQLEILCSGLGGSSLEPELRKVAQEFPNRVRFAESAPNIQSWYENCRWIIGGGRVALEGATFGCQVFVFGENKWLGLLSPQKLPQALRSNFGDIGIDEREEPVDWQLVQRELHATLEGRTPDFTKDVQQKIVKEFSRTRVAQQFQAEYRLTRLQYFVRRWIPCLMYHKIPDQELDSQHKIWVIKDRFEQHLQWFCQTGFSFLTFRDLKDFETGKRRWQDFPRKPLLLTFDDGYKDNLKNAQPLLEKYGAKATLFLLADTSIQKNTWDAPEPHSSSEILSRDERSQLNQRVYEIGSHGLSHASFLHLEEEEIRKELRESKALLEKEFSRSIDSLAYPFGHTSERIAELAREEGYQFAVNTDQGGMATSENPWSIFRVNIFPQDGPRQLLKKTSAWYPRYFYFKRKNKS